MSCYISALSLLPLAVLLAGCSQSEIGLSMTFPFTHQKGAREVPKDLFIIPLPDKADTLAKHVLAEVDDGKKRGVLKKGDELKVFSFSLVPDKRIGMPHNINGYGVLPDPRNPKELLIVRFRYELLFPAPPQKK